MTTVEQIEDELEESTILEQSQFDWKTLIVAGVGFSIDAFDLFIVGIILPMVYEVYYTADFTTEHAFIDGVLKTATHIGNILGQLLFGYLADKLGRKQVY